MKLWSKEALVLGGIYGVLGTPFSLLDFKNISFFLFLLFIGCVLSLCFNKKPRFIKYIINHSPEISYYLSAIGWIVYFTIIALVGIIIMASVFNWQDCTLESIMNIFNLISVLGIPVSLVVAFIRKRLRRNKEYL